MYIVVSFLFVYKFTDHYHRVETQLQLINIVSRNIENNDVRNSNIADQKLKPSANHLYDVHNRFECYMHAAEI
jgi:hypothetical protein